MIVVVSDGQARAKPCLCLRRARARAVLSKVPPEFKAPRLSQLRPRPDSHPRQAEIIRYLKANPDESYLFCGKNGAGKTHFSWALYRHAYASKRRVVACSVQQLLAQFRNIEIQQKSEEATIVKPFVIPSDLEHTGTKWCLFLDEIEKARPSEFASEMLFTVLKAAKEYEHQLIVTSNFTPARLIEHWGRIDAVWGTSIVRRLSGCTEIDLF